MSIYFSKLEHFLVTFLSRFSLRVQKLESRYLFGDIKFTLLENAYLIE